MLFFKISNIIIFLIASSSISLADFSSSLAPTKPSSHKNDNNTEKNSSNTQESMDNFRDVFERLEREKNNPFTTEEFTSPKDNPSEISPTSKKK